MDADDNLIQHWLAANTIKMVDAPQQNTPLQQSALDALDYAFKVQFGELFSGLFMALESAPQATPSLMHRLLSAISMVPDVDVNEAIARFNIGLDNLIIAYDRARRTINGKLEDQT